MADRKITDLTALAAGSQATGDLLTIVDVSEAAATDKNKKITVESLFKGIPGNVGIGVSSPVKPLHVDGTAFISGTAPQLRLNAGAGDSNDDDRAMFGLATASGHFFGGSAAGDAVLRTTNGGNLLFGEGTTERLRIDSSGRVGINDSTPDAQLDIGGDNADIKLGGSQYFRIKALSTGELTFNDNDVNERMRIDSSGRVGIGTTSPSSLIHGEVSSGAATLTLKSTATSGEASVSLTGENSSGTARTAIFKYDSADLIRIGTSSGIAMRFETNDAERMRLTSGGNLLVGQTNGSFGTAGHILAAGGQAFHIIPNDTVLLLNRQSSDGEIVRISQDGNTEGTISVSGSTVSYNGGHLARWSQLASGAARTEILRGSVLSNLDEMCEWGEEDNEQLNRMQVSSVEGDRNVSGVFQAWDDDDDTYTNDFYCAMTGDFVIRIAQGTTVARGDLLMSAGDGTAKPQDDDIVRSKTIAKVTSTTVSTTYADGSYCVPCVLMAC
ncbi:hypothetical protein [uncultured Mediterranean phage uvMED]|nr:hypothetical protein [uncultured Mediterranean phage uvMED]